MKYFFPGVVLGLIAGAAATWLLLRPSATPPHPAPETEAQPAGTIHLSATEQATAGIVIAQPEPVQRPPTVAGFARALEISSLAGQLAEREAAQATLTASGAELDRLKTLGPNAAARTLEAAQAAVTRDRAALDLVQARLLTTWGQAVISRTDLPGLIPALVRQEKALVRVEIPAGQELPSAPIGAQLSPLTGTAPAQATEWIGPAPNTDAQSQGQAFLVIATNRPPAPGLVLAANVLCAGTAHAALYVPRSSVVQHGGALFVFVQTAPEIFQRRKIEPGETRPEGIDAASGLAAGDRIVVKGAQQLLSREFLASGGGED